MPPNDHPDLDPARARRLARIAAAAPREVPGRQAQFGQRLEAVRQAANRRARREVLRQRAASVGRVMLAVAVAVGLDRLTTMGVAAAAGLLAWAVLALLSRLLSGAAARRGASAWDWQTGRHRVLGNPAARVQQADQPRGRSSSPFTGGTQVALFSRRPSPTEDVASAWHAFVETAELVESSRRRLLQTLPVGRVTPGAVDDAVEGLRLALDDALAWLPGWAALPELADDHAACRHALDEAAARLDDVTTIAATTSELEALQGAVEAVVMPLDAFADAERTWRRTWRLPRG